MSVPSRSEVFVKMSEQIKEMRSTASMMAHLHNTEGNDKDKKLAVGWLMIAELFKLVEYKIILLGQGRMN